MKEKLIILSSVGVGITIFLYIIDPNNGSVFNMIAYTFFIMLNKNHSQGGESTFILVFDFLFATGISYALAKFLREMSK